MDTRRCARSVTCVTERATAKIRTDPPRRPTAAHTALLRGLADWAHALDGRVRELDVMEETEDGAGLWALVRVHEPALETVLAEHAVMRVPPPHGWSGYRAEGVLPTGHRLMISI
ncbi:hypothetical protein [Nocardiopsis sp. RV163]|uniref:hypothetical protein n=1 Tax=Nocardiopsis sp. RV163 TaxID=1661388 RepID=UPI000ACF0C17|nr:hypothetical protein [Nocardiopsis sp. RV163]